MVREQAARGFGAAAEAYERGRPGYPAQAVAQLTHALDLRPGRRVVEVGAGTGKLTALLVPTGAEVVAVDPVRAMRERLAAALPEVQVLDGAAERLPLAAGGADAVVAAQAFHWFDGPAALAEFARVLGPGGRLGLMWNVGTGELWARLRQLLEPYEGGAPRYHDGAWGRAFDDQPWFAPLQHRAYPWTHTLPLDAAGDRVASTSFVAALPQAQRAELLGQVRDLLEGFAHPDGRVAMPYRTDVFWSHLTDPGGGDSRPAGPGTGAGSS